MLVGMYKLFCSSKVPIWLQSIYGFSEIKTFNVVLTIWKQGLMIPVGLVFVEILLFLGNNRELFTH